MLVEKKRSLASIFLKAENDKNEKMTQNRFSIAAQVLARLDPLTSFSPDRLQALPDSE